ncbi:MAG: DNA topoisomerase IV subunit B, partial [Patescibacteria group bacterium]
IIMTDADVDGSHIRTLLLTLFYRYFPQLMLTGHLYIAQPPLFRVQKGKMSKYVYNEAELEKVKKEFEAIKIEKAAAKAKEKVEAPADIPEAGVEVVETTPSGISIQRYKGLGEMNPGQLWETTMDPATRVMRQVTLEDAEAADQTFDMLMGNEVAPRKRFIQTHAKSVKNLDI